MSFLFHIYIGKKVMNHFKWMLGFVTFLMVSSMCGSAILSPDCTDMNYISDNADYIIEGKVENVESKLVEYEYGFNGYIVKTYNTIRIEKYVKGYPIAGNRVQIVTLGGNASGMNVLVEDQPNFIVGMAVRVYLQKTYENFSLVCAYQGVKKIDGNFEPIRHVESGYVWEEGMEPVLNLTPLNFDLFYYDIDSGQGGEYMKIDIGEPSRRMIDAGKISYHTSVFNSGFKYSGFGNYSAIAFLGEKYLAAYLDDSKISSKPLNLLSRRILSKVLIDEHRNHSLIAASIQEKKDGENVILSGDYEVIATNVNMASQTADISIIKKGMNVFHIKVNSGDTVVYEKAVDRLYSVYDVQKETSNKFPDSLPIIALHVDSIGIENGSGRVIINGIFQLSDVYIGLDPDYGLLGITEISEKGLTMKNRMIANLSISDNMGSAYIEGAYTSPIYFINNIRLKLAKSKTLRFFVYDEIMPRDHERRGTVYTRSSPVMAWDGLNFPGFSYNIDSNSFSEKMEIMNISGRKIPRGYLKYTTGVKSPLEVAGINGSEKHGLNASFMVFGIGTDRYVAVNRNSTELSKILIEHTDRGIDKKTLAPDEVWELGEGYNLTIRSLEVRDNPRRALLSLSHNGIVLKEDWIPAGGLFSYYENVSSDRINAPEFFTYLDAVFVGSSFDIAQLRYTFLRSDNITRIQKEDRIGVFRIIDVEPDVISMVNDIDIYLRPGNHLNLIGNLSFRVADSDELRFYPSNTRGQEIPEESEEFPEVENTVNQSRIISYVQPGKKETEKAYGFEIILAIITFFAVHVFWRKRMK